MAKRQTDSGDKGKATHLHIRVGEEEMQTWKYAAELDGQPFSPWVRAALWDKVNRGSK